MTRLNLLGKCSYSSHTRKIEHPKKYCISFPVNKRELTHSAKGGNDLNSWSVIQKFHRVCTGLKNKKCFTV